MNIFQDLQLPLEIDKETQESINKSYFSAVHEIGKAEIEYIKQKIDKKVKTTMNDKTKWVADLAGWYSNLYKVLLSHEEGKAELSENAYKLIASALHYFVDIFDVIPDFTEEYGYLDDCYVFILCISSLKKNEKDSNIVKKYFD